LVFLVAGVWLFLGVGWKVSIGISSSLKRIEKFYKNIARSARGGQT
jgi:hypothetical protein